VSLSRHRESVIEFHNAYAAYLEAGPSGDAELRGRVIALAPRAQAAMRAAGIEPVLYPPPAVGGPVQRGLASIMFQHERLGGLGGHEIPHNVLDWCRLADAQLEHRQTMLRQQRANPLYWVDRLLRALLGIPAYLLSLILPASYARIDRSVFGPALRLISAAGTLFGIYIGGRDVGWW